MEIEEKSLFKSLQNDLLFINIADTDLGTIISNLLHAVYHECELLKREDINAPSSVFTQKLARM